MQRSPRQHGRSPIARFGGLRARVGLVGRLRGGGGRAGDARGTRGGGGRAGAPQRRVVKGFGNHLKLTRRNGCRRDEIAHKLQRLVRCRLAALSSDEARELHKVATRRKRGATTGPHTVVCWFSTVCRVEFVAARHGVALRRVVPVSDRADPLVRAGVEHAFCARRVP